MFDIAKEIHLNFWHYEFTALNINWEVYKSVSRINSFVKIACVNLSIVFSCRNVHDFMTIVCKPHASMTILVILILARIYFHELQMKLNMISKEIIRLNVILSEQPILIEVKMAAYCYTFTYSSYALKIWTMQMFKKIVKRMQIDVHCERVS